MYVCLCNRYRDDELRQMARSGISCAVQAYEALGSEPLCGCCVDFAQEIIDEEHGHARSMNSAA